MADELDNRPPNPAAPESPGPRRGQPHWLLLRGPLVAYIVVVLAVLVAVNVVASRHDHSWDLTKNRTYSLSAESLQILHGLKAPLQMLYFGRPADFASARDVLGRYARASNKVDVQYLDPDRRPDLARQYKIQTYGTVVVQSGGRQELVSNVAEQDLTNAIVRTLKGEKQSAYFVEGEGEHDPDDTGRSGYSDIKDAITAENFNVKTLVLAQTPAVPADCGVLIIAGPTKPFFQPEVDAIAKYVAGGGRVLYLATLESKGPLVDYFAKTLNVKMTPDVVIDTSGVGQLFGANELMPIVAHYDPGPITQQMSDTATLFPFARTVEPGAAAGSAAVVTPLLETSPNSQAATSFSGQQVNVSATDRKGPLPLGVSGTLATTAGTGAGDSAEARFVVYGSADFPDNNVLGFQGNRDLFINTLDWLAHQENFITIRPAPPQSSPINLSAAQMRLIFWGFILFLPGIIVILGVAMWLRRRAA